MVKNKSIKILFLGDIVGKIGRRALAAWLPGAKKKYKPDLVVANVENLAHGKSITDKTWEDISSAGVDFGTSGNHIFKKPRGVEMLDENYPIIRPANYAAGTPGQGYKIVETSKGKIMIANLLGQIFIDDDPPPTNPFNELTSIIENHEDIKNIIVDFHAEATSEKVALGLMFDGKISAVLGTHTHVPTADCQILPQGTGYVTDVGMVGAANSVIGGEPEALLLAYQGKVDKSVFDIPEKGECLIQGVILELDPKTGRATKIDRLDTSTEV